MFTRRTVISYEKLESCTYRLPGAQPLVGFCEQCATEVGWITPYQALALTGLTLREIFRRIEAHKIHISETASGLVLVCPESLKSQ